MSHRQVTRREVVEVMKSMNAKRSNSGCDQCGRLAEAFEAMREALQQFHDIYPDKARRHPDVIMACNAARAALALADKAGKP